MHANVDSDDCIVTMGKGKIGQLLTRISLEAEIQLQEVRIEAVGNKQILQGQIKGGWLIILA